MRSGPPILNHDPLIVDISVLYQSTGEETPLIPVNSIDHLQYAMRKACRDLYAFEFEVEFCRHGREYGGKTD